MESYKVFKYRWVILAATIPIIICSEIFWLTLSPISSLAEQYYHVGSMSISMFTTSYLIMFIVFTFPASWVIDRFGFRTSLIIGSLITAVFGVLRAAFAPYFVAVMIFQYIIAIGQPFLVNVSTKIPANWFPVDERATASGLLTMAQYLGFIVPMVFSPIISESHGIPAVYKIYAAVACVCAIAAILLTKERPMVPPGPEAEKEDLSFASVIRLFKNRNFLYVLVISFISMGVFNSLLTLIESILKPRGLTADQAGLIGAAFVIAGVIGAVLLPIISDKRKIRKPFFVVCISLLVPLYLGITYLTSFALLVVVSAAAGFLIMGVAPILFQHGAEVAYPVKEGTSFGVILLMGQISGTLFVLLFETISGSTGQIAVPMLVFIVLTALQIPLTFKIRESEIFKALQKKTTVSKK